MPRPGPGPTGRRSGCALVIAFVVLAVLTGAACRGSSGTEGGNDTGLPDGTVKSKTYHSGMKVYEICVTPDAGGEVKCLGGFTKDEVSGCSKGSFWPECYHLSVKQGRL
jgi:hypothetical protein